jgi:hypothetical protein
LLTVSRRFMNVANSVLWRMAIILKANRFNLFVSSVAFVFWYHSPNFLDTPRITADYTNNIIMEVNIKRQRSLHYQQLFGRVHRRKPYWNHWTD